MQYVSGQSLEQAGARLSLPQKVQVIRDVAEALHEAHRQGIVHRDIKPATVAIESASRSIVPRPDKALGQLGNSRGSVRNGNRRTGRCVRDGSSGPYARRGLGYDSARQRLRRLLSEIDSHAERSRPATPRQ